MKNVWARTCRPPPPCSLLLDAVEALTKIWTLAALAVKSCDRLCPTPVAQHTDVLLLMQPLPQQPLEEGYPAEKALSQRSILNHLEDLELPVQ